MRRDSEDDPQIMKLVFAAQRAINEEMNSIQGANPTSSERWQQLTVRLQALISAKALVCCADLWTPDPAKTIRDRVRSLGLRLVEED